MLRETQLNQGGKYASYCRIGDNSRIPDAIPGIGAAQAQATRTWVSGVGDDANPCSRTAPCKTFPGAISKTATGGEINCLDPGGFGAVTITKAITISCDTGTAGVLVSGTNGIIVSVATAAKVHLEGLDIEGLGTGINGVTVTGGAKVFINKCSIRNFSGNGVNVVGTAGARVIIQDSLITGNTGGVNVAGAGGASNSATLIRTTIDNNAAFASSVTAPSALLMSDATLLGSPAAVAGTGAFNSFGNNKIFGSTIAVTTIAQK